MSTEYGLRHRLIGGRHSERLRNADALMTPLAMRTSFNESRPSGNGVTVPANLAIHPDGGGSLEQRLLAASHENQRLRSINERLALALADITQQRTDAHHMAHHDGLTGLPNRALLMQRLQDGIAESFARQRQMALMFIDLDGFKVVNDRYGHAAGDKLLTVVASRIASCVRGDDVACRYGGDEFVVMLSNIGEAAVAVGIADEIRNRIDGRYWIDGQELQVSASIGLALYPTDGEQWEALLSCADASMYRNKLSRSGRRSASLAALDRQTAPGADGHLPTYVRYQTDACGVPL